MRLDLTRTRAVALGLAVAIATRLAKFDPQHVVDVEREPLARFRRQNELVVLGSDDLELFHANAPPILRVPAMLTRRMPGTGNIRRAPRVSRQRMVRKPRD